MMDELIRKQTVLNMIDDVQFGNITNKLSQLHEAVRNLPSVDAVEVVRCENCDYWHQSNECFSYGMCTKVWMNRDATFYCKSGERKTDV